MPSPKRRVKRYVGGLSPDMEFALLFGHGGLDEADMRAAWREYGAEVKAGPGLVPWAAIAFDGAAGHSSPYCYLGDGCGCRLRGEPGPVWRDGARA